MCCHNMRCKREEKYLLKLNNPMKKYTVTSLSHTIKNQTHVQDAEITRMHNHIICHFILYNLGQGWRIYRVQETRACLIISLTLTESTGPSFMHSSLTSNSSSERKFSSAYKNQNYNLK